MKQCPQCDRHLFSQELRCPFCRAPFATTSTRRVLRMVFTVALLGTVACSTEGGGADPSGDSEPGSTGDDAPDTATTTAGTSPATTMGGSGDPTDDAATSTPGSSTDTSGDQDVDDWDDNGCSFYGGCPPDSGGIVNECDVFAQDCPPDEKCLPWANDGGAVWNATRCTPIDAQPGGVGEPCSVEGSAVSGVDDCDIGAICLGVDRNTNEGICAAMCGGTELAPECPDGQICGVSNGGVLALCLDPCNPLLAGCPEGQGCYPVGDEFACYPVVHLGGAQAEPCVHLSDCDPGTVCLAADSLPSCDGANCCSTMCDVSAPTCPPALTCAPWYSPGSAPSGFEDLGACIAP